jgi:predicted alpha/beta-hydrolase family hydrolase
MITRVLQENVDGYLHQPENPPVAGLVLTHGAGANCRTPMLITLAEAFKALGIAVLRCDLPFRQQRPSGPPFPAQAAADRDGLRKAVELLRSRVEQDVFLGGHSYGGRQASMLAAEDPALVRGLLLLSFPLHPPDKPEQLRSGHFPHLRTPAMFVHGTKDPFGSAEELDAALALIPAKKWLLRVEGAGHDLKRGKIPAAEIARVFSSGNGLLCKDPRPQRQDSLPASD